MSMMKFSHAYVDIILYMAIIFGIHVPKSSFVWNSFVFSGNMISLQRLISTYNFLLNCNAHIGQFSICTYIICICVLYIYIYIYNICYSIIVEKSNLAWTLVYMIKCFPEALVYWNPITSNAWKRSAF